MKTTNELNQNDRLRAAKIVKEAYALRNQEANARPDPEALEKEIALIKRVHGLGALFKQYERAQQAINQVTKQIEQILDPLVENLPGYHHGYDSQIKALAEHRLQKTFDYKKANKALQKALARIEIATTRKQLQAVLESEVLKPCE